MSTETARLVLIVIAGVEFIVWLAGLQFLFSSARVGKSDSVSSDLDEPFPENWMVGRAEVQGQPAVLVKRTAALLVRQGPGAFGAIKIVESTDNRLVFERIGPAPGGTEQGRWVRRGELRFSPAGRDLARIDYAIERGPLGWFLVIGALFQALGLVALVLGVWLISTLVVPSADPAVRTQAVQMVQAIHFLWPPFLMGLLYRRGIRSVRATFDALTHNLPYAE